MVHAIHEFHKTTVAYGQPLTKYVFTDKPSDDHSFFCQELPGVLETQKDLDEMRKEDAQAVDITDPGS